MLIRECEYREDAPQIKCPDYYLFSREDFGLRIHWDKSRVEFVAGDGYGKKFPFEKSLRFSEKQEFSLKEFNIDTETKPLHFILIFYQVTFE